MLFFECVEYLGNEAACFRRFEVEFEVAGFPGAVRAPEDHGVSFIEKHLGGAAGVFFRVVRDHLEDKPDVANARPDMRELPRRFRLGLVVKPGRQIPRDRRRVL